MLNLVEEIEIADQLGLDVFAVGEHHRPDYLIISNRCARRCGGKNTKNKTIERSYGIKF